VEWVPARTDVGRHVAALARAGDVVITLGAGDVWRESRVLLSILQKKEAAV